MVERDLTPDEAETLERELRAFAAADEPSVDHLADDHVAAMLAEGDRLAAGDDWAAPARPRRARSRGWRARVAPVAMAAGAVFVATAGLALADVLPTPAQHAVEQVAAKVGLPINEPRPKPRPVPVAEPIADPDNSAPQGEQPGSPATPTPGEKPAPSAKPAVPADGDPAGHDEPEAARGAEAGEPATQPETTTPAPDATTEPPAPKPVFVVQKVAFTLVSVSADGMTLTLRYDSRKRPCFRPGRVGLREGPRRVLVTVRQRIAEPCESTTRARTVDVHLGAPLGERKLVDAATQAPAAEESGARPAPSSEAAADVPASDVPTPAEPARESDAVPVGAGTGSLD
jgi:hypothetical protein